MVPHTALVPVPAAGVCCPGSEARLAGAGEGPHRVGTVSVRPAVVGKVAVGALVNVDTSLVWRVISVSRVTVAPPATNLHMTEVSCQSRVIFLPC